MIKGATPIFFQLIGYMIFSTSVAAAPATNFQSGNSLYSTCTTEKGESTHYQDESFCVGYIAGVADGLETMQELAGRKSCTPDAITQGQIRDVVKKYITEHPEKRHYTAASIVIMAIINAYPGCKIVN